MNYRSTVPVFLAFLAMGFGDAVGPFVGLAMEKFQISNLTAQLIPFVGFAMFGILAIPMGIFQDKKGKKFVLGLGLAIMLIGLLVPALAGLSTFPVFLVTILLVGAGATTLQVAGNPIMRDVSPEGTYSRNLSFGQFVKAIGSLSGPLIPVIAARWLSEGWSVIFPIYSTLILITIVALWPLRVDEPRLPNQEPATFGSAFALLRNGYVAALVLAIFLYVGAEVSVSSGIALYLKDRFGLDITRVGLLGTGLFFLALTIGRFSGGVILNWIKASRFLPITCSLSILGILGVLVPNRTVATASFFLVGLGFANIFPLIFSMVVDRIPEQANAVSGLMVTSIVGGAFIPPLMGLVADWSGSMQIAFSVPLGAILYISAAAFTFAGHDRQAAASVS